MGQVPPRLVTFLQAARDQARDLTRDFVSTLILSRRRQFAVVATCASLAGVISLVTVRGAQHARATWSTCPTLVSRSGAPGESVAPDSPGNSRTLVPKDWRVVALPRDVIAPDVRPGDLVDLVSNAEIVASRAVVIAAAGDSTGINVAVAPDSAPIVATAAQSGVVSVLALG